ncbi:hypothetical protein DEG02_016050 [Xanthomonas vasicola]|nr:hypothetical protein DEG03_016895 [Xanthomonas vasicola]RJL83631.1 hypothetical protein DEF98_017015 [Xanthomonas vasicola]RJL88074.1 hypothetical protein DEF95_016480 [Xanthomonas vasicola]RJL94116.1 hypothetical protein DEF96_016575 [Xanthomonas vasicola]RJL95563.1 hypothetical protein DEG05_013140 [Xanthomonas vasicola]
MLPCAEAIVEVGWVAIAAETRGCRLSTTHALIEPVSHQTTQARWTHLSALRNEVRTDNVRQHIFALEYAIKIDPTRLIH